MMADQKLLTQTLPGFASTLVRDVTISDVLPDLAGRAAAVAGADGAGVSLRHSGRVRFAIAPDEDSLNLERVQGSGQAGLCVDVLRYGEVVTVADLRGAAGGWGACGQAAREAGS